jgi:5-methyltetrahydropteroyltriglutamate--homocysteine methyltransferase
MSPTSPGLYLSSTGSYPRGGDAAEFQALGQTIEAYDRGECTMADVREAESTVIRRAIAEQVKAGLDVVTDGLIRWRDPISHIAGKLENVRIKDSQRFLDTDFHYRQPVLTGKPTRKTPLVLDEFAFARNALGHLPTPPDKAGKLSIKPVLTGPYTLAKLSLSEQTGNGAAGFRAALQTRAMAYAEALAAEITALVQSGADLIQVDEPAAIRHPEDWEILEKSLAVLAEARDKASDAGRKSELALYVYYQDCAPLYEKLAVLPVDVIGLDFSANAKLVDVIVSNGSPKPLGLGLVDGRNPRLEDAGNIVRQVERLMPRIKGGRAYLGTSSGLDHLKREVAYEKLALLSNVRVALGGHN